MNAVFSGVVGTMPVSAERLVSLCNQWPGDGLPAGRQERVRSGKNCLRRVNPGKAASHHREPAAIITP